MNKYHYLGVQVSLMLGVLSIGVALGTAISLQQHQQACIAADVLPKPGAQINPVVLGGNPCWATAKQLQSIANNAGIAGAILLLGGALTDRFEEEIVEVVSSWT